MRSCDASLFKSGIEDYKQCLRSGHCLRVPVSSAKSCRRAQSRYLISLFSFAPVKVRLFPQNTSAPQKRATPSPPPHTPHRSSKHTSPLSPQGVPASPTASPIHPETIAQGHLFTAYTFLLRTSQPKASDFRGKKVRVMKRSPCAMVSYIYGCVGRAI